MFGIGTGELLLLLVIALIVLGPERMPKLARDVGRALAEFRRTSDELREEFLNADKLLTAEPAQPPVPQTAIAAPAIDDPAIEAPASSIEPLALESGTSVSDPQPVAQPDGAEPPVSEPGPDEGETAFDKEAREAREKLHDPARMERAAAEGWKTPTDEAGTSDRWG